MTKLALDQNSHTREFLRKALRLLCGFIAPLLLFEIYRFLSLGGLSKYRENLRVLSDFIDSQRIDHWSASAEFLGTKLTSIVDIPGLNVWASMGLCVIGISIANMSYLKNHDLHEPENYRFLAPGIVSGLIVVGTFLFLSAAPFARQAASSFYLLLPFLILIALDCLKSLTLQSSRRVRSVGIMGILLITIPLASQALSTFSESIQTIRASTFGSALNDQRAAAKVIRESDASTINLDGWFQSPEYQLLSGVPAASMPSNDGEQIKVVTSLKYLYTGTYEDFLSQKDTCREVLYSSENVLVCWPKDS